MKEREIKSNVLNVFLAILFVAYFNVDFCFSKGEIEEKNESFELVWSEKEVGKGAKDYFEYLKATYQHFNGKVLQSLQSFEKLFEQDTSVYAYDGFIHLLYDLNQFEKIIKLEDKVKKVFDDHLEIQLIFAQSFLSLNMDKKAEELFEKLIEKYPDNEQVAYYAAVSFIKNNQFDKALSFIEKCLAKPALHSKHFLFNFLASKIYFHMGRNSKALELIKKSVEQYPRFERGWLLKALLEEQLGKINESISGYKRFLDIVGRDLAVEKQLVNLLFSSKRYYEAADVLRKMKIDTPQYFFDLALLEWKANNFDLALQNIEKSLELLPDFKKAKLLKIEILLSHARKDQALGFVQNWLMQVPDDSSVVHILLLLRRGGVVVDSIINSLQTVAQSATKSEPVLAALSDLYLEQGDNDKALDNCKKLVSVTKDDGIKSKLLFQIGYVYFKKNEIQNAEKFLKDAKAYKPVYPSVYNLLAYCYALKDENLEEALELSELALQADPDCYYYLDTKGYVLLKLGKVDEAIELFQKALKLADGDEEVAQHLKVAKSIKTK